MATEVDDGGKIVAIRGAVIDALFAAGWLPPIDDALSIEDGEGRSVMAEVQAHPTNARCAPSPSRRPPDCAGATWSGELAARCLCPSATMCSVGCST